MIRIQIDDRAVLEALRQLQAAGADLRPVFYDFGGYLTVSTRQRFAEGRAPDGTPWAPNRPSTLARKRDTRPLIGETRRLGREFHYRVGASSFEFGSSLEYAAAQQLGASRGQYGTTRRGGPIPWGDIAPRPFLGLSEADRQKLLEIINDYLGRALGG